MRLIRLADQVGFILRVGKLGVAYFGSEWRACIGWGQVADRRAPSDRAQRKWIEVCLWPPALRLAKWRPI